MERLIAELRAAVNGNLFTVALQGTLALVDVSAALSSENGQTEKRLFVAWYQERLSDVASFLAPEDAYQLRCGLLHQGKTRSKNYNFVIVTLPGSNTFHNNILDDALNLDFELFCNGILDRIEKWWEGARNEDPVRRNAKDMVRLREHGMPPYIVGATVLA